MADKKIKITCGGETEFWEKEKALDFFKEAAAGSDGHEAMRYEYIVECIEAGETVIDDDDV